MVFELDMAGEIPEQDQRSDPSTVDGILQPRIERSHHQMAGQSGLGAPY